MQTKKRTILLAACCMTVGSSLAQANPDDIVGRWKAIEKTLVVEIYRTGDEYRAKVIDFTDHHNPAPVQERKDDHNPDPKLRSRGLLGLDVLRGMHYDAGDKNWTDGTVYDVSTGKEYSAELELDASGHLNVRAYKGITLLGKTLSFVRN